MKESVERQGGIEEEVKKKVEEEYKRLTEIVDEQRGIAQELSSTWKASRTIAHHLVISRMSPLVQCLRIFKTCNSELRIKRHCHSSISTLQCSSCAMRLAIYVKRASV